VRRGTNTKIPPERKGKLSPHTRDNVYGMMFAQISREYASLPGFHEITAAQVRWYYDMMRPDLIKQTTPKE
jgi:hypothetical protein